MSHQGGARVLYRLPVVAFKLALAAAALPLPPTPIAMFFPYTAGKILLSRRNVRLTLCLGSTLLNIGAFLSISGTIINLILLPRINIWSK